MAFRVAEVVAVDVRAEAAVCLEKAVFSAVQSIVEEVGMANPRFRDSVVLTCGSFYAENKLTPPDEFDFIIALGHYTVDTGKMDILADERNNRCLDITVSGQASVDGEGLTPNALRVEFNKTLRSVVSGKHPFTFPQFNKYPVASSSCRCRKPQPEHCACIPL
ncbi:uncharacterized protein LOC128229419 isoform X2 [Mya arenaria]|nr:uncharacterized protein LOC128229419 isoform X2 [Mya arenaria]